MAKKPHVPEHEVIIAIEEKIEEILSNDQTLTLGTKLDPALVAAVGSLMMYAASCDFLISHQLLRLVAGTSHNIWHAYPLVVGMDLKIKIQLYRTLLAMFTQPDPAIGKILDKVESAYQRRNELAHGLVEPHAKSDRVWLKIMRAREKHRGTPPPIVVTLRQIRHWTWQLFEYPNALSMVLDANEFCDVDSLEPPACKAPQSDSLKRPARRRSDPPKPRKRRKTAER